MKDSNATTEDVDPQWDFGSNAVRLSMHEWMLTAGIVVVFLLVLPVMWKQSETFEPGAGYRIPYAVSSDYWLYKRVARHAMQEEQTVIIGDSVVWGEFVTPQQTLAASLNSKTAPGTFANGGVNGLYPLAVDGALRHHAKALRDRPVLLHCNLLWLSSAERDMSQQTERQVTFNHPRLLPQFGGAVAGYHASASDRVGIVMERGLPYRQLARHVQVVWFENLDIPTWSIEHPYTNPYSRIGALPEPLTEARHGNLPRPWFETGIDKQDMPWMALDGSLQWQAFQRIISLMQQRGNSVFVFVGPFNEHVLLPDSGVRYSALTAGVSQWLSDHQIPHHIHEPLPSALYGDASHPLAEGYAQMADALIADPAFEKWRGEAD